MCGIAGLIAKDSPNLGNDLINMLKELIHRGKDATGVAIYENRKTIDLRVSMTAPDHQKDLEETVKTLVKLGMIASVDSGDVEELRRGARAGAHFVLSLDETSLDAIEGTQL